MGNSIIGIMGPSGAGKSTLGDLLAFRNNIAIPQHCTTRNPRDDDRIGFYKYLDHETYRKLLLDNKFFISSGDGPIVIPNMGNFYGVLTQDCYDSWKITDKILLFLSYKDIDRIVQLKQMGYNISIVNLSFKQIEEGIYSRLVGNTLRNHTPEDIKSRIVNALMDEKKYRNKINQYIDSFVYTDELNIEETYKKVCMDLKLIRRR